MDAIANHNRAKTFDRLAAKRFLFMNQRMMRGDSKHQFKIAQSCKAKAGVRRRRAHGANDDIRPSLRQRLP
ncbi:Uncharacterised protein [Salmonella enterica subsp. enterica serovar Bovismorbificans]|uniref:Uncharacterized protein n=1 Tax=Salmonella enterica subsp. enterica serovar Bovismorbificans TaxID=58097 RepID=A0A655BRX5_SALET|nr:Uncharacterised protein [Salmonella enterica subsp. enterica serovar Bovismorbificans]CNV17542.1 Uncharacterised protein [Salmonella enterica subsp. enterica serovar Bovismorbificans]